MSDDIQFNLRYLELVQALLLELGQPDLAEDVMKKRIDFIEKNREIRTFLAKVLPFINEKTNDEAAKQRRPARQIFKNFAEWNRLETELYGESLRRD